jgi:colanic acid biosynthesis glycosyl transferase WcaI
LRVLVVSSYYAPETAGNAPYVTGVCEQLAARGHDVVAATGFPHYPGWSRQERGVARTEHINGVTVRRRTHYVPRRPTLARRGLYEASLAAAGLAGLPAKRPDAIVAIVPSQADAVVARIAATVYRRPYGIVFQDLMGVAATQVGAAGETRAGGAVARLELSLARRAAAIAIVTEGYRPYLVDAGVDTKRIMRVYNWAEYTAPSETRERTRQRLGWAENDVVCLYAGSLGHKQGLETLVDTATHLNGDSLRIVFAGDGSERQRLVQRSGLRRERVDFLPPTGAGEYESLLEAADILLVSQKAAVGEMSIASKLGPYLRAGRPIIAAVSRESETGRELSRTGAGLLVEPGDPQAVALSIRELADDPRWRASLGARGRAYSRTHLTRHEAIVRYEEFLRMLRVPPAPARIYPGSPSSQS